MPDFDVRAAVEVGDGAGHLQDAVVRRTLLADVGREVYFDSTIYLPVISVYFLILLSKLSILSVDRTIILQSYPFGYEKNLFLPRPLSPFHFFSSYNNK